MYGALAADWPVLLLILGGFVAGALFYPHLPDRVPSHWNFRGEVDGYSSRLWGAIGIPLMNAGIYVLMTVLPAIDPRRQNYARFAGVYRMLKFILTAFLTMVYFLVLFNSLGFRVPVERVMPFSVSLLFLLIGNSMGKIRPNYFVGIRTPWTLASEQVWRKTHRLGGFFFVGAGLTGMAASLLGGATGGIVVLAALAAAIIVPVVYSCIEYRRESRE
ncbi:MAG: SdpI family protein [Firmicutes bacterium]|nr:SdpI family protein [Bacillota bacterium]